MPTQQITYRDVITNAIIGFNAIQNKLNNIGAGLIDSGRLVPTSNSDVLSTTEILNSDAFRRGSVGIGSRDDDNILSTTVGQFGAHHISFWSTVGTSGYVPALLQSSLTDFYIQNGVLNSAFDNTVAPTVTINNNAHGFTKAISSDYYITIGSTITEGSTLFTATSFVPGFIANAPADVELTVTADVDGERIIYIPEATIENGFVTETGMVAEEEYVYTTEYNSTDDCVDFIFNSGLPENTGVSSLTYTTVS